MVVLTLLVVGVVAFIGVAIGQAIADALFPRR